MDERKCEVSDCPDAATRRINWNTVSGQHAASVCHAHAVDIFNELNGLLKAGMADFTIMPIEETK